MRHLVVLAFFAVVGLAMPLSAQCSGGGCPTSGNSAGGCGGCPSGNKVGRVDRPQGGGVARGPVAADPAGIPSWQKPGTDAIEGAAADQRPIVLFFATEDTTDHDFHGEELAALSKDKALFIKVMDTGSREASPWATESIVPTSKLLSDNPARDYGVQFGKGAVIVCDWHGNEYLRTDTRVKADKLESMLLKVKEEVEDANEKLQKNLDKAREYLDEKSDRKGALKYLLKNFKEGVVGLTAQEESIRMYHDILDAARSEMADLVEKKDLEGLKALAKDLNKTDLESEIDAAVSGIN